MYEIFTGKAPYDSDSPMSTLLMHVEGKATPPRELNQELPESIEKIIGMAMATDPEKRFQSFDELRQSLEHALQEIG
jgi:serine/threonine-protein kinase